MTELTPLDRAHLRAEETGASADRLAFWSRLAEAELSLLLDAPAGDGLVPRLFDIDGTSYALAFDRPLRLAAFAGEVPTATLSGRALARLLVGRGLGLGLNLEDAPSAQLLPPEALVWLFDTLSGAPGVSTARIEEIAPPGDLPDALLDALDAKLPLAAGQASFAYLARGRYDDGSMNHLLAFVDPAPDAEPHLAMAVQEAMALSGLEAGTLDVVFPVSTDPLAAPLARHGLRIDLPAPEAKIGLALDGDGATGPPRLR